VLAKDFDPRVAAERAASQGHRMMAEVLLDQRVAAGIGNIWKCESLFARGIDPRTRVADLSVDELAAIYSAARELMLARIVPAAPGSSRDQLAVYSKTGQPCPRCSAVISAYQLGDPPRWTWSCPRCQPPGGSRGASS
jgi:endonuclease-8